MSGTSLLGLLYGRWVALALARVLDPQCLPFVSKGLLPPPVAFSFLHRNMTQDMSTLEYRQNGNSILKCSWGFTGFTNEVKLPAGNRQMMLRLAYLLSSGGSSGSSSSSRDLIICPDLCVVQNIDTPLEQVYARSEGMRETDMRTDAREDGAYPTGIRATDRSCGGRTERPLVLHHVVATTVHL